jgi:hypothetical protein
MASGSEKYSGYNKRMKAAIAERRTAASRRSPQRKA